MQAGGLPSRMRPESAGGEPCDTGMEKSAVALAPQELLYSGTGMSTDADKSRGFAGRPHGAKPDPPALHMRLDDALQRALEHPKYRMTALRLEEAFIDFIESGEQRMVINESLAGFGKCIAHRVAKLYGLETLTVSNSENSENTSSVGVRRTRKSVHIPQVKLRDLYTIRHPWAPDERPQAQDSAGPADAQEPGAAARQPPATAAPASGDIPAAPAGAAPAPPAPQTCQCPGVPADSSVGVAQEAGAQCGESACAAQQASAATGASEKPANAEGILPGPRPGTVAAAGAVEPLIGLPPSKGLDPGGAVTESLTESVRLEREAQQKGQHAHQQRAGGLEEHALHERGAQPAPFLPSASENLSQSGGSSVLQGFLAGPSSQARSSEAQESSQPPSHVVTPITSGESLTASRSDRSEGSQIPGEVMLGFSNTRRRRGSAGRSDKLGASLLGRGISSGQEMGRDMPLHEGQGTITMPGGTHGGSGARSPASSMAGHRAGSRKGRQGALDRSSELAKLPPHETPGSFARGKGQLHLSEWREHQPQGKQGRPDLMQGSADVPISPFSKDPRAAPSQAILEQQMSQRLSLETGHHVKPQLAMSEPLYRPHGQQSSMTSLPLLPPATSGSVAPPHQSGFLSPLLPSPSGQLPGAHPSYGSYGASLAIPPGYMLVPAPGAVQGMPMYQAHMQPYPIPGHPGYYYMPPGAAPPLSEGHMGYPSAQHGLTWDPHGAPYNHNPRPPIQAAGMHLSPHGRLPPGMAHQYMASPHMWPAQAAVRLPPQQQPNQAQIPQQAQQYQPWQADPQWQPPSHRQNRQRPVTSTSTGRSGNLSRQHSGENASRRVHSSRQQPRQQQ